MKRCIALWIALILVCGMMPAYALSGITPTEETWYVTPHSDDYRVYYFATVCNNSDKPASINDLLFEIVDRDGVNVDSTSKYKMYPDVLTPGQSGYLVITKDLEDIDNRDYIDHYNMTIISKVNEDKVTSMLNTTAEYLQKDEDDNENVIRTTVTNSDVGNAFEITTAMAVRDAANKLLYVAAGSTKDIGLTSGNSLMMRAFVKSDIVDEWEKTNVTAAVAEAIAYTEKDTDDD